jgi:CheY-like chemotaxis protein
MATILVVDDNELNRDMLSRRLVRRGYRPLVASDGQEAVDVARTSLPDLVIMDINMPVMDGYEATRRLKADPETHGIPIVALTAYAMGGDLEKTIAAGCDDDASKPVDLEPLVGKIQALLSNREAV